MAWTVAAFPRIPFTAAVLPTNVILHFKDLKLFPYTIALSKSVA